MVFVFLFSSPNFAKKPPQLLIGIATLLQEDISLFFIREVGKMTRVIHRVLDSGFKGDYTCTFIIHPIKLSQI